MIFVYKKWDAFCAALSKQNLYSVTAREVLEKNVKVPYVVLKHDVETDVSKAYQIAIIENQYGHRGTYYIQAYLLESKAHVELLQKMQAMGHEISYHYDVMDSNKGDIDKAITEFEKNKVLFESCGFEIRTVCQHGNPVVERVGYTSNRDFFRNKKVQQRYSDISDVMVDFPDKAQTTYSYFSDAGRRFKKIYDPFTNDIINSDDKNTAYENLEELLQDVTTNQNCIISIHPHRWTNSTFIYLLKTGIFKSVKIIAKIMIRLPLLKKMMSRYYYLAKKI